jgi:hypothetical protein
MLTRTGAKQMDLQMPVIVLLLVANVLWFIVGWGKGFQEGKREAFIIAKNYQKLHDSAR